ncbi:MAG TPA: hypothetical protein VKR61_07720 [Bryobacteraceae bacterium]|nr:hypothetical protein [Bryobacteraceae bacterium]
MPAKAKIYISVVSAAGIAAMVYAFVDPPWTHDLFRCGIYVLLSLLAATFKLRLPGLNGTMSIGFVFVLLGISEMGLPETMLMACSSVIVQCLWRSAKRPAAVQVLFSVSAVGASLLPAYQCSHFIRSQWHTESAPVVLAVATCLYFLSSSLLVSGVLSLVQRVPLRVVWEEFYLFAVPYHLLGGALVALMTSSGRELGWQPPLLMLPVMCLVFLFYRMYLTRYAVQQAAVPATNSSRF